ncbi:MAG TPA: long-chain fatty acid--CoA ligase [Gemmatimonadota bacterium]|jgi:long-chain acyl-CoA synthetase
MREARGGVWTDVSARELRARVEDLAYGLGELGVGPGDRVALLSENRVGWAVADLAILLNGALTVPVYPSLGADVAGHILRDSRARVCVVSTPEQLEKVREARPGTALERVIAMDRPPDGGGDVLHVDRVAELGRALRARTPGLVEGRAASVDPHAPATILYTSGTTGLPKGVLLTHENILSNIRSVLSVFEIGPGDVTLSFLPLCHIFERTAGYYTMLQAGAVISYAESVETVPRDLVQIRPTIVLGVPRFYEKTRDRVLEAVRDAPPARRRLFAWAMRVGGAAADARIAGRRPGPLLAARHVLADRLVLARLRARTGGRIRFFVSGGAALPPEIARFFWAAGLPILEGYGLSETAPVIAANTFRHVRIGSVGRPVPGVEVRIAADGEILCRGPNVMLGYHELHEETAAAVRDGWFHTGDVGHQDEDGFLFITDRKKDLFKITAGKYVAPQPIEGRLQLNRLVGQAVVVGSRRKHAAALIVPERAALEREAREAGVHADDFESLLRDPRVLALYEGVLREVNASLAAHEKVRRFALLAEPFTIDSGELTPTLKVKRSVVEARYRSRIDAMYGDAGG